MSGLLPHKATTTDVHGCRSLHRINEQCQNLFNLQREDNLSTKGQNNCSHVSFADVPLTCFKPHWKSLVRVPDSELQ